MHPLRGVGNFPRVVDTLPAKPQNCNWANFQIKLFVVVSVSVTQRFPRARRPGCGCGVPRCML